MLRAGSPGIAPAAIPSDYDVEALPPAHWIDARAVAELDGPLIDRGWEVLLSRVLPGGLFIVRDRRTSQPVGTASAVHNPAGSRFYFPAGGQLGYLVVEASHRGQGLGYALVTAVVERFRAAGYQHLWVGVEGWRLPAIRTYLRAGYLPFLHPPDEATLATRWTTIFDAMDRAADVAGWPRTLSVPARCAPEPRVP